MNGNETRVIALHYATHVNKKENKKGKKKKKNGIFIHFLTLG